MSPINSDDSNERSRPLLIIVICDRFGPQLFGGVTLGYIDSNYFPTVAENNLDPETELIIRSCIKEMTGTSVISIEEGYEKPGENNVWKVLVKLQSGTYFIAEIPDLKNAIEAMQRIAGWPLSSSYLEALSSFISFLDGDERRRYEPILDILNSFGLKANIAAALKRIHRQHSYRRYILDTGDPVAAQVQRALEDMAAKLP